MESPGQQMQQARLEKISSLCQKRAESEKAITELDEKITQKKKEMQEIWDRHVKSHQLEIDQLTRQRNSVIACLTKVTDEEKEISRRDSRHVCEVNRANNMWKNHRK